MASLYGEVDLPKLIHQRMTLAVRFKRERRAKLRIKLMIYLLKFSVFVGGLGGVTIIEKKKDEAEG